MKIAVIYEEDNGDKSVWYPDVTEQEWCDAVDGFINTGSSTSGTIDQILDEVRDAFSTETHHVNKQKEMSMLKKILEHKEFKSDYNGHPTALRFRKTADRAEIEIEYDGYREFGYGPEIMVYGGDADCTLYDLVKEQLSEIHEFQKTAYVDDEDCKLVPDDYAMYDHYPFEAILAFEDILINVLWKLSDREDKMRVLREDIKEWYKDEFMDMFHTFTPNEVPDWLFDEVVDDVYNASDWVNEKHYNSCDVRIAIERTIMRRVCNDD